MQPIAQLILAGGIMFGTLAVIAGLSGMYNLNIKAKTVGHGQHGTARWATKREIRRTYLHISFEPELWRKGEHLPKEQGIVVGCRTDRHLPYNLFRVIRNLVVCRMRKHPGNPLPKPSTTTALVDTGDVHAIMIGAAGVGKTAYWLYPCLEYAMASGMSFLSTDTKGDVVRNYGRIAQECYGYRVGVIDLRNPTRSDGFNLLHLVSKYMDAFKAHPETLLFKAKAERYAKIISKTIITAGMDGQNFGQNQFFYDAAEGLLTSTILLVAEFCPPTQRHIVSVFKIIQELMAPSQSKGQTQFQVLLSMLPDTHKAKWFAGAATSTADQAMASVMSTTLARLNAFLDSEMEQLLCFDTAVDAETFCKEKSALFLVMPEEDPSKFFMVSLIIQQLYREILAVADDNGGKLPNRAVFYADEFGTCATRSQLKRLRECGNDVLRQPFPAALHCPHHPEPGTVGEKLRQGGGGDHRGQHPGNHLRRICPQQRNCPSDEQIPGQPDGAERIGEQGQGQWLSVPADDRAAPYDPGRAEVHAQGSVHRDENRCLPHEGEAKAVFPVGDLLWRAIHGSRQRKPACGIRRQEGVGKGYPGEVPTAPSEEGKTA